MKTQSRYALIAMVLIAAACGGDAASTTSQAPPTTTAPTTSATAPPVTTAPTSPPPSTPAPPPAGPGFEFRQAVEDTDAYSYTISYPILVDQSGEPVEGANDALVAWVADTIAGVQAAADRLDAKATLTAQVAPELLTESVLSVSGVSTRFVNQAAGTVSRRHGWIVDLDSGATVTAGDLMIDGDLSPLSDAARAHLIADVLGSEDALSGPDGLLPVAANFDAVWLTATGVGVGFDESQVAASAAGSPAFFIPFAELAAFLSTEGVLAPLADGDSLPEI